MGFRTDTFPRRAFVHLRPIWEVLLLLQELQRQFGLTYIFISHSLPVVAQVATRIAVMRACKFMELGPAEQVLHQPKNAYTRALLAAAPNFPKPERFPFFLAPGLLTFNFRLSTSLPPR
jgi:ABC-type methionine transport system ATPase subunit